MSQMRYRVRIEKSYPYQPCNISKNQPVYSLETRRKILLENFDTEDYSEDQQEDFLVNRKKGNPDFFLKKDRYQDMERKNDQQKLKNDIKKASQRTAFAYF